ncbi:MAG: penicillin-binding protein activator [Polyangia bacterium]
MRFRSVFSLLLSLAVCAAALGCHRSLRPLEPSATASADPAVEREFAEARKLFEKGRLELADRAFVSLIEAHGSDPLAREAAVYRARIALRREDPKSARRLLADLIESGQGSISRRARFYDGVALQRLGRDREAIEALEPFVGRLPGPQENMLLLDTLWRAGERAGEIKKAIEWLDGYLEAEPGSEKSGRRIEKLLEVLEGIDDDRLLEEIEARLREDGRAIAAVRARRAMLAYERGEIERAARIVEEIRRSEAAEDPRVAEIAELLERRTELDLGVVGAVLPLSGRSRLVGEAVLQGLMIGAKSSRLGRLPELEVVIRDSRGDPEKAADAIDRLVFEDRAAAVIGPVDIAASEAAARRAEKLGVPILCLSVRSGVAELGDYVFRNFASNRAEVRSLVDEARRRGGERFAVLYPTDGYGEAMRRELAEELGRFGDEPVAELAYDPGLTDFSETAQRLAEEDFDVLFAPDRAQRIALLAPALAAAGIWPAAPGEEPGGPGRAVQLLVPSVGFSASLRRRAGRYLEGALFATYFHERAGEGSESFDRRYRDEYGREPTHFSAFGHDAVRLIAAAIGSGMSTRYAIRDWLADVRGEARRRFSLAAPFSGFDHSGGAEAGAWLMTLVDGEIEVLR